MYYQSNLSFKVNGIVEKVNICNICSEVQVSLANCLIHSTPVDQCTLFLQNK